MHEITDYDRWSGNMTNLGIEFIKAGKQDGPVSVDLDIAHKKLVFRPGSTKQARERYIALCKRGGRLIKEAKPEWTRLEPRDLKGVWPDEVLWVIAVAKLKGILKG